MPDTPSHTDDVDPADRPAPLHALTALLAFSSSLRADKPFHRIVAWVLLVAFGLPAVIALLHVTYELLVWVMP